MLPFIVEPPSKNSGYGPEVWFLEHQILYNPCCDAFNNSSQDSWACSLRVFGTPACLEALLIPSQSGCISCFPCFSNQVMVSFFFPASKEVSKQTVSFRSVKSTVMEVNWWRQMILEMLPIACRTQSCQSLYRQRYSATLQLFKAWIRFLSGWWQNGRTG